MRALKDTLLANINPVEHVKTLIVGDIRRWTNDGRNTVGNADFHYATFWSLSRELLQKTSPDMVLSPLVSQEFDVIDLARHLADLGYGGSYRVIANSIPNTAIIRAEVALVAPSLDFDIYELPAKA